MAPRIVCASRRIFVSLLVRYLAQVSLNIFLNCDWSLSSSCNEKKISVMMSQLCVPILLKYMSWLNCFFQFKYELCNCEKCLWIYVRFSGARTLFILTYTDVFAVPKFFDIRYKYVMSVHISDICKTIIIMYTYFCWHMCFNLAWSHLLW